MNFQGMIVKKKNIYIYIYISIVTLSVGYIIIFIVTLLFLGSFRF